MVRDYFDTAQKNEDIFRNILRDLKENRQTRPMGLYIPEDLNTEDPIEEAFNAHSKGSRYGVFTITDFEIEQKEDEIFAIIFFENIACMSGGGAGLRYIVNGTDVTYMKSEFIMRS